MAQHIIKQQYNDDHIAAIIKNIVTQLRVNVCFSTIDETVQAHPLFPEIEDLNDILNEWGIQTKRIESTVQDLNKLNLPVIAKIGNSDNQYILITTVEEHFVTYIDTCKGLVKVNNYIFEQNWNGVAEQIEMYPDAGEKEYELSRKSERFIKNQKTTLRILMIVPLLIGIISGIHTELTLIRWLPFFIFETIGTIISIALLLDTYNEYRFFNKILLPESSTYTNSRSADLNPYKIGGVVTLNEILTFYHTGSLVFLMYGLISSKMRLILPILAILNAIFIPFTIYILFNIGMRKRMKCLTSYILTNTIPLLTFPFLIPYLSNTFNVNLSQWMACFVTFIIPATIWLMLKPSITKFNDLSQQVQDLKTYKHPDISRQLFNLSPTLHIPRSTPIIYSGDLNANIQIILIISLTDTTSGYFYLFLRELIKKYPNTNLTIKFARSNNYFTNYVTKIFLSYSMHHTSEESASLIEAWFLYDKKDVSIFAEMHKIKLENHQILNEAQFLDLQTINLSAPTIFINGRTVPGYFDSDDIKYLIKDHPLRLQTVAKTEKEIFWKDRRP